ncbi:MAG: tRNA epoxyqueuosine(34) reductase QueG [Gemmatimonadota bacterium]|nr:tRNA epoxyqueuosine(34) reductase QueG [Gemmatimonadota bacterium]
MAPVVTPPIEERIKAQAYGLGFDLAGIATLGPVETADDFESWLDLGYAGEMEYLSRGAVKRRDNRLPYPGTSSAIVVGMNYGGTLPSGPIARYARGDDYHDVVGSRLRQLHRWLEAEVGGEIRGKEYVDTGPILERDLARRAGLGWFGKNTNLLNPDIGSFFFLGVLLVDLDLTADQPFETDRCGRCTRCLDACPTSALVAPGVLDATRCISYLTIELKGPIPEERRADMGGLVYGCDICQDVCPWNVSFARDLREPAFAAREAIGRKDARTLAREILALDDEAFRVAFKASPVKRAKLRGLKRNAAVALGNVGTAEDVPALEVALAQGDSLVSEHAAWALRRIAMA